MDIKAGNARQFDYEGLLLRGLAMELNVVFASVESSKWCLTPLIPTVKVVGGALTVATGATICTGVVSCALGAPMAAFGASDAWQGGGMVVDAVRGIKSDGFNLIKTGFESAMPEWGGAVYEGTSLGLNIGALGAKVPLVIGSSEGFNQVTSFLGYTASRWDNARSILGNVVSQSTNRLMLMGSAVGKAYGFGNEVNSAGQSR